MVEALGCQKTKSRYFYEVIRNYRYACHTGTHHPWNAAPGERNTTWARKCPHWAGIPDWSGLR